MMIEEKKKMQEYKKIFPGDFIWANTPGYDGEDKTHLIRPFLVIGKKGDVCYCLYSTTKDKYKNNPCFYKEKIEGGNNNHYVGNHYINCSKIYEVDFDEFVDYNFTVCKEILHGILNKLSEYVVDQDIIDYKSLFNEKSEKNICLYNGKYYYINRKQSGKWGFYELIPLVESIKKNNSNVIKLNKKDYELLTKEKIKIPLDSDIRIISNKNYKIKNDFKFGDILLVNNSNKKIVYITQVENNIYYCDYDDISFFRGLSKINDKAINNKIDEINSQEKEMFAKKIDNYLSNNGDYIRGSLKKQLSKIKR